MSIRIARVSNPSRLLTAAVFLAAAWWLARVAPDAPLLMGLALAAAALFFVSSFVPRGRGPWLSRKPLLLVPYAAVSLVRAWPATALFVLGLGAVLIFGPARARVIPGAGAPGVVEPLKPNATAPPLGLAPLAAYGSEGSEPGQFRGPRAIAIAPDGRIYVADSGNKRVQVLSPDGKFVAAITASGGDPLVEPFDLVIVKDQLLVLDSDDGRVYRFDLAGKALGRITPDTGFYKPRGMSINDAGELFITDTGGSRVVKLDMDGRMLAVFGGKGDGPGSLDQPAHARPDAAGQIWVTDVTAKRIQVYLPDGTYARTIPIPAASPFTGSRLAALSDGTMIMSATEPHKIERFSAQGQLIGEFGEFGQAPGQFRQPTGVTVAGDILWVADTGNNRVQKLQMRP